MDIYSPPKSEDLYQDYKEVIPSLFLRSILSFFTLFIVGVAPNISTWLEFEKMGISFDVYLTVIKYQLIFSVIFSILTILTWLGKKSAVNLLSIFLVLFTISAFCIPYLLINHLVFPQIFVLSMWPIFFYKHKIKEILTKNAA